MAKCPLCGNTDITFLPFVAYENDNEVQCINDKCGFTVTGDLCCEQWNRLARLVRDGKRLRQIKAMAKSGDTSARNVLACTSRRQPKIGGLSRKRRKGGEG